MKKSNRTAKSNMNPESDGMSIVIEAIEEAKAKVAEMESRKTRKMVELSCMRSELKAETEKATLLVNTAPDGTESKVWLAKSIVFIIDDGADPDNIRLQMPAWVYYQKGLKQLYPEARWFSEAVS